MENSDILHGKILENLSALRKILAKIACNRKNFWKTFHCLGFNLMFSGPQNRFLPLNLDWNPKSFSEGNCLQRKTQTKF